MDDDDVTVVVVVDTTATRFVPVPCHVDVGRLPRLRVADVSGRAAAKLVFHGHAQRPESAATAVSIYLHHHQWRRSVVK